MSSFTDGFISLQLISSVDPKFLKLTKSDEQIYTKFREEFPDLSIQVLDPELLKSADAKEVRDVALAFNFRFHSGRVGQAIFPFFSRNGGPFVTSLKEL